MFQIFQDFPRQYENLRKACEELGCFRILNHKIPLELMQEMKRVVTSLFDLPMEIKKRNGEVIPGSGYWPPGSINPLFEAFGLYDMASSQAVHNFCSKLDATPSQRDTIEKYGQAIHELMMDIGAKIAESVGLDGNYCKEWPCQYRISRYNFTPKALGSTGLQTHTDSGFVTILQDDENVGGLEVIMNKSSEFVAVHPLPGSFLVNLGDMAAQWKISQCES